MADPVAGLAEMGRVTRRDGLVAACVWDHETGTGPLGPFWEAAHQVDPDVNDESTLAGAREGHLGELFRDAGMREVEERTVAVSVEHPSFDEWWDPFTLGVGPAGRYVLGLDVDRRAELRQRCREAFPPAPCVVSARAWAARGVV